MILKLGVKAVEINDKSNNIIILFSWKFLYKVFSITRPHSHIQCLVEILQLTRGDSSDIS
jgi:hypothetical protein